MEALREILETLQEAEEETNIAEAAWAADFDDDWLEACFNEKYASEYAVFMAAAERITVVTSGRIDQKTAR